MKVRKLINDVVLSIVRFLVKNKFVSRYELLFSTLEAFGANFRAINKNLAEARKLEAALKYMGHPDTSEINKNRGVDLVLTCGLCDPCRVKANAVTYIRNLENDVIDAEFNLQEAKRKLAEERRNKYLSQQFGGLL